MSETKIIETTYVPYTYQRNFNKNIKYNKKMVSLSNIDNNNNNVSNRRMIVHPRFNTRSIIRNMQQIERNLQNNNVPQRNKNKINRNARYNTRSELNTQKRKVTSNLKHKKAMLKNKQVECKSKMNTDPQLLAFKDDVREKQRNLKRSEERYSTRVKMIKNLCKTNQNQIEKQIRVLETNVRRLNINKGKTYTGTYKGKVLPGMRSIKNKAFKTFRR